MRRPLWLLAGAVLFFGCQAQEASLTPHHRPARAPDDPLKNRFHVTDAVIETSVAPEATKKIFVRYADDPVPKTVIAEVLHWNNESALCVKVYWPKRRYTAKQFKKAFFSEDGEHGWQIARIAWSPNGRFLAYQLCNSGGHQPFRSPVRVLDIENGSVHNMEDYVRRIPDISNVAVTYRLGKSVYWSQDGLLHFHVMDHEDKGFAGEYLFAPSSLKAWQAKREQSGTRQLRG